MNELAISAAKLKRMGQPEAAESLLRRAITLTPADPLLRYDLSMLLLEGGAFEEGWRLYEARREIPKLGINLPKLPFPEWNGESIQGKNLLVWPEQGLGDKIMFSRYLRELEGAHVTLLCEPALLR